MDYMKLILDRPNPQMVKIETMDKNQTKEKNHKMDKIQTMDNDLTKDKKRTMDKKLLSLTQAISGRQHSRRYASGDGQDVISDIVDEKKKFCPFI